MNFLAVLLVSSLLLNPIPNEKNISTDVLVGDEFQLQK